jgi:hypothetical protein
MNSLCTVIAVFCLITAAGGAAKSAVGDVVSSAWQQVCQSFADAASQMLQEFAKAFAAIPPVSLTTPGITSVYAISLGIAATVAALLLIGQVIRTAFTHDGSALATGLLGVAKAALAFLLTIAIATTALSAADELTVVIIQKSFGSTQALSARLGALLGSASLGNPAAGTGVGAALLLIFGILGILLVIVLWFEMLLRNAAIAVLIATSPIAAAGLVSDTTKAWWSKLVSATVQLIILKPVIALVFAVGLSMTGQATDIETLLAGMLVLVLAVFAWPAVARFFTFASVQVAGGSGLGTLLGFAAGRASGGGGGPAGVEPSEFSRRAEQRTMTVQGEGSAGGAASGSLPGMAGGGASGAGAGPGAAAGGVAAGAATGGVAAVAIAGAKMAQQAVNSLTGHMEQMAGHAGMQGANPYAQPAGTPRTSQAASSRPLAPSPQETGQPAQDPGTPPPAPPPPDLNSDSLPAAGPPPVDDTPYEMPEGTGEAGAS